jgi:hypothetical protein
VSLLDSLAVRRRAAGNESLATASLTVLFLVVHTAGVWNLAYSGRPWWFACVTGLAVGSVALAREISRPAMAAAGLAIAAAASAASAVWHLPAEPGAGAAIALAVLVAAAVRASRPVPAAAVAAAGAALTAMTSVFHPDVGAAALGVWCCAVTAGLLLRFSGTRQRRLAGLIDRFARRGIPVRLQVADGPTWPPELNSTICRVVREALTGITRHAAPATAVTVMITRDRETVTIEVTDDAPATGDRTHADSGGRRPPAIGRHVESLGGTYHAGPDPVHGYGWSVRASVPVAAPLMTRPRPAVNVG